MTRHRVVTAGRWMCIAGAVLGLIGMFGWAAEIQPLVSLGPKLPPMMPNTALGLFLLGTAGSLTARKDSTAPRVIAIACASAALAIGLGTMGEYVVGRGFAHLDTLWFGRTLWVASIRPPPLTALAIALLAFGILLVDARPVGRVRPAEWLLVAAGICALVGLTSIILGDSTTLYRVHGAPLVGISLPTVAAVLLVSLGVLFTHPTAGFMRVATGVGPGGALLRLLVVPAAVLPLVFALAIRATLVALGIDDAALGIAMLALSTTLAALILLVVAAVPLEHQHEMLEVLRDRSRELVEGASDGIFVADVDGRYTQVNDAGLRMLGYSRDELVGKHIVDLLPIEDIDRLTRSRERLLRGASEMGEWRLRRKDGTFVPVEVSARILPDGRWQTLVRDISERTRLQSRLRRSHADLEQAQSVAGIGSWRLDVRHNRLEWTNETYRIFGVPVGTAMTYGAFLACVHPADRDFVDEKWTAALRGAPYDVDHRIVVDGVTKWVREKADLEFDEHGLLIGGVGITHDITERRRLEDHLRLAEAKASGILSIALDAIISVDEKQRIVLFNHGAETIFGYSEQEALGAPLETLVPERFRAAHRRHVAGFAARGEVAMRMGERGAEIIGRRKNGEEFPADAAISKLEVGGRTIMTVALRDVTEDRRARREILEAQERYQLALAGGDLAAWDWNVKTGDVTFSPRWADMRGLRADEVRPRAESWFAGVHPDDLPRVKKRLDDHFEGRTEMYRAEHRVRIADGRWLWVDALGKVFARDDHGLPVRFVGVELDITDRKRTEEEQAFLAEVGSMLASTLEIDATLEQLGRLVTRELADLCLVYVITRTGEIERRRAIAREPSKQWIGDALGEYPVDRDRGRAIWDDLEAGRSVVTNEVPPQLIASFAQNEGHRRTLEAFGATAFLAVPLFAHNTLVAAMGLVSSTPGRKYTERDRRLAEQLAQRAAFAIENGRLYDEARRAIQTRDDVLGIVAHDLRNPLQSILMQASLLERSAGAVESRIASRGKTIARAGERMNRLIQDLLDVTKMEAGRLSIAPARLSARDLVTEAVDAQDSVAHAAGVQLRLEISHELPDVWADRERSFQIFENLIGNALKFSKPGGRITVGAAPRENDVLFWVEDNGPGIAEEEKPHLFERFWQAHKATRHGAGLGLPIVKGLVEAHGGTIWVESTVGVGSAFYFTLPKSRGARDHVADTASAPH